MAIAFDNSTAFNCIAGGPYTQAFSMGTAAGGYLLVGIFESTAAGNVIGSITFNGFTLLALGSQADSNQGRVQLFGWDPLNGSIPTGSKNLTVTFSAQPHNATTKVVSYTGVDLTTPVGAAVTNSGLSAALSVVVGLGASEWAVGAVEQDATGGATLTLASGNDRVNGDLGVSVSAIGDNTTGTITYNSTVSGEWAAVGINLKPGTFTSGLTNAALMMAGAGR